MVLALLEVGGGRRGRAVVVQTDIQPLVRGSLGTLGGDRNVGAHVNERKDVTLVSFALCVPIAREPTSCSRKGSKGGENEEGELPARKVKTPQMASERPPWKLCQATFAG